MARTQPNEHCKAFLEAYRKVVGAQPEEKIDKRYGSDLGGYLAPNDKYYSGHCAYCAEVAYLQEIYADKEQSVDGCYPMGHKGEGEHHLHCIQCERAPARSDACQAFRTNQMRRFFTED